MAQVMIHLSPNPGGADSAEDSSQLVAGILSKHGLALNNFPPSGSQSGSQTFHLVATPDAKTAQTVVAELQSQGITAFIKPQTSAP